MKKRVFYVSLSRYQEEGGNFPEKRNTHKSYNRKPFIFLVSYTVYILYMTIFREIYLKLRWEVLL